MEVVERTCLSWRAKEREAEQYVLLLLSVVNKDSNMAYKV
ncbi:hypothetical protein L195_g048577, partial [Trifolium pratense]